MKWYQIRMCASWLCPFKLKAFVQKRLILLFGPIFIFWRIKLIFGRLTCLTWKAMFHNCFCRFALRFWEIFQSLRTGNLVSRHVPHLKARNLLHIWKNFLLFQKFTLLEFNTFSGLESQSVIVSHTGWVLGAKSHLVGLGNQTITSKECLIHNALISEAEALGAVAKCHVLWCHILWHGKSSFPSWQVLCTICSIKDVIIIITILPTQKQTKIPYGSASV